MLEASLSRGSLRVDDPPHGTLLESRGEALLSDGRVLTTRDPDSGVGWRLQ